MLDRLDIQIIDIIGKAPALVRSVTKKEIETGVLYPSVTAMDIKRNLPSDLSIDIIEGRLRILETDGYIYDEGGRWWLTDRGRSIVGSAMTRTTLPQEPLKPMRDVLEETFAKFETPTSTETLDVLENNKKLIENLLDMLRQGHEQGLISSQDYSSISEKLKIKLTIINSKLNV